MIKQIEINDIASYKELAFLECKKINFIYGGNGTGKSTISNLLNEYPNSTFNFKINCDKKVNEKILVFDKNFVKSNFLKSNEIKGIFTLGEANVEIQKRIEELSKEKEFHNSKMESFLFSEAEIENNMEKEEQKIIKIAWEYYKKWSSNFQIFFKGARKSKSDYFFNFFNSNYVKYKDMNSKISDFLLLKKEYQKFYIDNFIVEKISKIQLIKKIDLSESESAVLFEKVEGNKNCKISRTIDNLNNSEWVKEGITFLEKTKECCPFCQQNINSDLLKEIANYFDEKYDNKIIFINNLFKKYNDDSINILKEFEIAIKLEKEFFGTTEVLALESKIRNGFFNNLNKFEKKLRFPSNSIILTNLNNFIEEYNNKIVSINEKIEENNAKIENLEEYMEDIKSSFFILFFKEQDSFIKEWEQQKIRDEKGKKNLIEKKEKLNSKIKEIEEEIKSLENKITSIVPVIEKINSNLDTFNFKNFFIKENSEKRGTLKIVRMDGTDVNDTLSEGEFNFIAFLYYYFLVYGSQEKRGINVPKIIVIDDPISSLDNNILFVVSILVNDILQNCIKNKKEIKQVFIFTHNLYFYKEVISIVNILKYKDVSYSVIKKQSGISKIYTTENNSIFSSYEMLWNELRQENISSMTAMNIMRRIIEHYFKIIGNYNIRNEIIDKFEGEEKLALNSFFKFMNDGSHSITDDFEWVSDDLTLENSLKLFEKVFELTKQKSHYDMMTRNWK
ncbi:hypothetical protein CXP39_01865 [Mesoplasma syrphidae]|uniref:Protein CR006 P-loop domain-containing protein n=1 Tax=Mesoplasma syrphidae TaxID=225999 RepID=A0A2K9C5H3_9MOLU|nr:AAA family ATPase [Mesoplasma syrphidae]AUF83537.1 hypothetical protein CXP39_01865 [Mesoplasma syrphidae]